ncbi:MAG: cupredoxin domain-containing protein [Candidatus Buchananbacteria bacterium]
MTQKIILTGLLLFTLSFITGCGNKNTGTGPTAIQNNQSGLPAQNTSLDPQVVTKPNNQAETKEISINNFAFNPDKLEIKVGTIVKWTNQESADHTIMGGPDWQSDVLKQGESFMTIFKKAGTYSYYCSLHPSMKGTIIVTE